MVNTFSNGESLTEWLVRLGAPALPPRHRYKLFVDAEHQGPRMVKVEIQKSHRDEWTTLTTYTETTRVSVDMAAVAAAKHAYEGLDK